MPVVGKRLSCQTALCVSGHHKVGLWRGIGSRTPRLMGVYGRRGKREREARFPRYRREKGNNFATLHIIRSHNRGWRPQARGPRKTIEKDKCAIFSENCAILDVINSRGYTQICVGLGDSLQAGLEADCMLSTKALIN